MQPDTTRHCKAALAAVAKPIEYEREVSAIYVLRMTHVFLTGDEGMTTVALVFLGQQFRALKLSVTSG